MKQTEKRRKNLSTTQGNPFAKREISHLGRITRGLHRQQDFLNEQHCIYLNYSHIKKKYFLKCRQGTSEPSHKEKSILVEAASS